MGIDLSFEKVALIATFCLRNRAIITQFCVAARPSPMGLRIALPESAYRSG
jgi:hypothetical protein